MFAQPNRPHTGVPLSPAAFSAWLVRDKPGERLAYYRGFLAIDRVNGTSALNESARRKLATVADQALALSDQGRLHLLQERDGDRDYSYWAVARAPVRGRQA